MTAPPATPQDDFDKRYNERCSTLGLIEELPFIKTTYINDECGVQTIVYFYVNEKTGDVTVNTRYKKAHDWSGAKANPACSVYLGCVIAEQVLSKVFDDVYKMPNGNPGYDFICAHNYRIDVKSSCIRKHTLDTWSFNIKHNTIADYFLIIAFDNREHLTPLHVWLIPGNEINHQMGVTIRKSTLNKWAAYELTDKLNDVVSCCNIMKSRPHTA